MTGTALCLALALLVAGLLRVAGARGMILAIAFGALLAGAFAFDRSRLPRSEPETQGSRPNVPSLATSRHAFTGQFTGGEQWLAMADSMAARGNTADAVGILIAAVKQHPRDYSLWTGLGTMLTEHGGGLNPGSELAFERAIELAPTYPAPRYFYGIAKLRSGDRQGALAEWRAVLATAPPNASWRGLVEERIRTSEAPRGPR